MISSGVSQILDRLTQAGSYRELRLALDQGERGLTLTGLGTTAKALYLALLERDLKRPFLVVTDTARQAEELAEAIATFSRLIEDHQAGARPQVIPALDVLPGQKLSPHRGITGQRALGLWRLATGRARVTLLPLAAALQRVDEAAYYRQLGIQLKVGEEMELGSIAQHLESIGYVKREPVETVGDFSIRGGILDVFPPDTDQPVRVEFFGDFVESMRRFDVESQLSVLKVKEVDLLPLTEFAASTELLDRLARVVGDEWEVVPGLPFAGWEQLSGLVTSREGTVFEIVQGSPVVVWDEPEGLRAGAERWWKRLEATELPESVNREQLYWPLEALREKAAGSTQLQMRELELLAAGERSLHVASRPGSAFQGNVKRAMEEGKKAVASGGHAVFFTLTLGELERMADVCVEYRVPFQMQPGEGEEVSPYLEERLKLSGADASTYLVKGAVRKGFVLSDAGLTVFGAEDLFEHVEAAGPTLSARSLGAFASDIADLKTGDYVVHQQHGVGRFIGIRTMGEGEQAGDFMVLEYAGDSKLYVPLTRLDLVTKFRGGGETYTPSLDRMGGVTWEKTKKRVKAKMRDMADELLKLYAQRKLAPGYGFSKDSNWQQEFEDAFPYGATKDQLRAVTEIKRDMEAEHPMDRLLCGDVGFGKTEVAMRAAFKALGDGKQVVVLAPTTVLALQHNETFHKRFSGFPVRIEMLSRLRPDKEMKQAVEDIAAGKVDVIIGTHRVLSKDIEYADLGLLIVDEEQRFGVKHKERLKQLKQSVDVLTMSATPIPRTLHMSLLGLRDLSVIETPPKDRLAVSTVVAHFDLGLIKTAIEQELSRGGQVYFIHNRIDTIFMRAASIQEMLPDVRVGVGHGQMGEAELERVLLGFMHHEFDVFVSTTIVENGIDIPLANTIVIENAERYGLSELYQLRGRVGRSNRRAYAYLLVPGNKDLSDVARKRLAALREFSDLGAGFKIAALDLELRGAGNLLGGEQHGHIDAVGYDTFLRLLEETVAELRGEEIVPEVQSTLTLGLELRIPGEYISDESQRLRAYKRIADAVEPEAGSAYLQELEDRYGPAPNEVKLLFEFSAVKSIAKKIGIEAVERRQGFLNVKFHEGASVDARKLMELVQSTKGAQFTPAGVLRVPVQGTNSQQTLVDVRGLLGRIARDDRNRTAINESKTR